MATPDFRTTEGEPSPAGEARRRRALWLKPIRNSGVLLTGRVAQGLISLAALAVAARALGSDAFGALVLLQSFALTIAAIGKFQSWQAILRYGAPALEANDIPRLGRLLKFCLLLDLASAVVGVAVVLVAIEPAMRLFGLPATLADAARGYVTVVLFMMLTATPTGVLRLLDRFDLMSAQGVVAPAIRLLGGAAVFAVGGGLVEFLVVWFAAAALGRLVLFALAIHSLVRRGLLSGMDRSLAGVARPEPGIWRFVVGTNMNGSLHLVQGHIGVLAVGWLVGPSAAAMFRIARQFADLLVKPNNRLLVPAIYPELTRLAAQDRYQERAYMMQRTILFAGGASAILLAALVLAGEPLIALIAGRAFTDAYPTMVCLAVAGLIGAWTFPLEPVLVADGRVGRTVIARGAALVVYLAMLYALLPTMGVLGAGFGAIGYAAISASLLLLFYWTDIRERGR